MGLWKIGKTETLQFVQFLTVWGLAEGREQILERALSRLELSMDEIFDVLKWYGYELFLEKMVVDRFERMDVKQFEGLFKIVNYFRLKGAGGESFFGWLEGRIQDSVENGSLSASVLAGILVHYANNMKEDDEFRMKILSKMQSKLKKNLKFLSME